MSGLRVFTWCILFESGDCGEIVAIARTVEGARRVIRHRVSEKLMELAPMDVNYVLSQEPDSVVRAEGFGRCFNDKPTVNGGLDSINS